MKKFSTLLCFTMFAYWGWAQNLPIVDFDGFTGSNLSTVAPGWSEADGIPPAGTTSSWTRDDFGNVTANGDAARINLFTTGKEEWILSPTFTPNANSVLEYDLALTTFSGTASSNMGSDDLFEVRISDDGWATFTTLASFDAGSVISNTGQHEMIDLSSYAGTPVVIGFFASEGTVNDPEDVNLYIDNVEILIPLPDDIQLTQILTPTGYACFSNSETITVEIKNVGTNTADFAANNAVIGVDVAGVPTYSTNLTSSTLMPDSVMVVTVTNNADFSATGDYDLTAHITYTGDGDATNDTTSSSIATPPIVAGGLEDFETSSTGSPGTLMNGWRNTGPEDWYVESDGTSNSTNTGPVDDHTEGGSIYVYYEATSVDSGAIAELTSPCFDISSFTNPRLSFWYHMYGANMGTLEVYVISGGVSTMVFSQSGQVQTAEDDPWLENVVDLSAFGDTVQLQFRGIRGADFESDMALDDIRVYDIPPFNLEMTEIVEPTGTACFGANETIVVEISNKGLETTDFSSNAATITVIGDLSGSAVGPYTTTLSSDSLQVDSSMLVTVTNTADFSAAGTYTLTAYVDMASDGSAADDTTNSSITTATGVSGPVTEDFESFGTGTGSFMNGWVNAANDDIDWSVDANGTSSSNTGPDVDHTLGTSAGQYIYIEATGPSEGDYADLLSPCIDISGLTNPGLSFWYHMHGEDMGTLEVYVISGGQAVMVDSISGEQQDDETSPWLESVINLAGFGSNIQLLFRGIRGADFTSDMALDDIKVYELPVLDMSATAIIYPEDGSTFSCGVTTDSVVVQIVNRGIETIDFSTDPTDVSVLIPGANPDSVGITLNTDTLGIGDTLLVTVSTIVDFSAEGQYSLTAFTTVAGDEDVSNDTTFSSVNTLPVISPIAGVFEDFESFTTGSGTTGSPGTTANGWVNEGGDYPWTIDAGGTGSTGTGPEVDHTLGTDAGIYIYTETTSGSTGDTYIITSPCVDLSTLSAPQLTFWYHMHGPTMGTLEVDVIEGGVATTVWSISGEQQPNQLDPYLQAEIPLSAYIGKTVQFSFRGIHGSSFTSDMALDDIGLSEADAVDASISEVGTPGGGTIVCADAAVSLITAFTNQGGDTLDFSTNNMVVALDVIGPGGIMPTVFDTLSSGQLAWTESQNSSFVVDMSTPGTYTLTGYVVNTLSGDADTSNDTLSQTIIAQPNAVAPYYETFVTGEAGWVSGGSGSTWELGSPAGDVIDTAASDTNAWMTGLAVDYNQNENSWVVSPCFDLSNADSNLHVALSVWWNAENSFDGAVLQASTDQGANWVTIGAEDDPFNWFNDGTINGNPGGQQLGWTGRDVTNNGSDGWLSASHSLDSSVIGQSQVIFRVAFGADGSVQDNGFAFDNFALGLPPEVDLGPDGFACIGSTLDAGNPGATYAWSTGDSTQIITIDNTSGSTVTETISVVVTDSMGFSSSDTIVVTIPASLPSVTATGFDALCFGDSSGMATAMGADGLPPYTYSWNTTPVQDSVTAVGLSAGQYIVTITDSAGCTAMDTVDISQPTAITVAIDTTIDVFCNGDSTGVINITAMGGTPGTTGYTYLWSNGDTTQNLMNAPRGNYTVEVTDSLGCVASVKADIGGPDSIMVAIDNIAYPVCEGDSTGAIDISISGGYGAPYDILWSTGDTTDAISGLPSGTYTVMVTDSAGCMVAYDIDLDASPGTPVASFTFAIQGGGVGFTNTSSGMDTTTTYAWDFGDGSTSTLADPTHFYTSNDTFIVTLIVSNTCGSDTTQDSLFMTTTGLQEDLLNNMTVFPNPSTGIFDVQFHQLNLEGVKITVFSMNGKGIYSKDIGRVNGNAEHRVVLPSSAARGVYLLQVQTNDVIVHKRIRIE